MMNIRVTVIGPGGTPVTGVTLRATIAGSTSTYRDPWPAIFPAPEPGVLTLETTGGGFNNDSVDILLNQGAPAAWTNPNVAVDRRGSDIAIDFCVFSIREVPLKVISPNDVVAEDYPVPYSPDLAAGQTSKVDADNDRLVRELGTRYADRAVVFDAGGGRPQYRGFDDFPKPHCLCMDPDPSTGKVLLTASTSGWDRVRHAAKSDLDPTLGGITYVLTWGEGSNALLVGVFVPKVKSMIARTRVSCVFYTSNTAKPEFQTDYPFGWRWFPVKSQII